MRRLRLGAEISGLPAPPVSILKPLHGAEEGLEQNLESFCRQDYPEYEILFSVREENDPAVAIVRALERRFPRRPMRLLILGPPRYLNAKVHGMEEMMQAAAHETLVINDSDVRVSPDYLRRVTAPLAGPNVGMVTCLSRGVPGKGPWSLLETLHMNTQFVAGVLAAWVVEGGLQFALGPAMVIRKRHVRELGGFRRLGDFLADDFVLGRLVAERGYGISLAGNVPDHIVCNDSMKDSLFHRLRWERSSRYSRPAGYVGQIFTHSVPLALAAWLLSPIDNWYFSLALAACLGSRAVVAWMAGWRVLRDPVFGKYWWLLPLQDLLSFAIWGWAFLGRNVFWRGAWFRLEKGGRVVRARRGGSLALPDSAERLAD
jgi:ceramide glucosyltransferase